MNIRLLTPFLIGLLAFTISCDSDDDDPIPVAKEGLVLDNGTETSITLSDIETVEATGISLTLNYTVTGEDEEIEITNMGYTWSASNQSPTSADTLFRNGVAEVDAAFGIVIEGLTPATKYYVRPYIETATSFAYGAVTEITTLESIASVVVINEGNFGSGDGSFDLYNSETMSRDSLAFKSANGFPVGGIIQNAIVHGDLIIATTNAVDKVEFINSNTFESIAFVDEGVATPFGVAADEDYAYVTNWGTFSFETEAFENSTIVTIDLDTYEITSTLEVDVQPQHIRIIGEDIYVSDVGGFSAPGNTVSVYTKAGGVLSLKEQIEVPDSPDNMVVDGSDNLWVLSRTGKLTLITTISNTIFTTIENVPVLGFNEKMIIDPDTRSTIFWLSSDFGAGTTSLHRMSVFEPSLSDPVLVGENFYGVGMAGLELYVSENAGFLANGSVTVYDNFGAELNELSTFPVGRNPNGFVFR